MMFPKDKPLRDRKWLDYVRELRCLATGMIGHSEYETVDPAHLGTAGKSIKTGDDHVIPLIHHIHLACHAHGEASVLREYLPLAVLMDVVKANHTQADPLTPQHLENRARYLRTNVTDKDFISHLRVYAKQEYEVWLSGSLPFVTNKL